MIKVISSRSIRRAEDLMPNKLVSIVLVDIPVEPILNSLSYANLSLAIDSDSSDTRPSTCSHEMTVMTMNNSLAAKNVVLTSHQSL